MSLKDEFRKMVTELTSKIYASTNCKHFLPAFQERGPTKRCPVYGRQSWKAGRPVSVLFSCLMKKWKNTLVLQPPAFVSKHPREFALEFGIDDPVKEMVGLASINAICQHVMRETNFAVDYSHRFTGPVVGLLRRQDRHGRFILRAD